MRKSLQADGSHRGLDQGQLDDGDGWLLAKGRAEGNAPPRDHVLRRSEFASGSLELLNHCQRGGNATAFRSEAHNKQDQPYSFTTIIVVMVNVTTVREIGVMD